MWYQLLLYSKVTQLYTYTHSFLKKILFHYGLELPRWCSGKESVCQHGDTRDEGLIHGSGRSPGGGNGNPLQYSYLENPMGRGAWQATVPGVTESDITEHARARTHYGLSQGTKYRSLCYAVEPCC